MSDKLIPVPSLSTSGWVTAPAQKADILFAHYFESNKSQTVIYGDNVSSLQWIVEKYGHDGLNIVQQLRLSLENYLNRYYDVSVVTVDIDDVALNLTGAINLTVYARVTENGVSYSVGKLLNVANSKIQKIIDMNNG